jgi:hypothetical protein
LPRPYDDRVTSARKGLLERFFDFYSISFGITAPPPAKQKLLFVVLIGFFVLTAIIMFLVAKFASRL